MDVLAFVTGKEAETWVYLASFAVVMLHELWLTRARSRNIVPEGIMERVSSLYEAVIKEQRAKLKSRSSTQ